MTWIGVDPVFVVADVDASVRWYGELFAFETRGPPRPDGAPPLNHAVLQQQTRTGRRGPGRDEGRAGRESGADRATLWNMAQAKDVLEAALELEPTERARIAQQLLDSHDGGANGGLDAEWLEEIERRARDIDERRVQFVSWSEARQEIEDSLRKGELL
jgi:putative addiction module component (TIGR02574 family)